MVSQSVDPRQFFDSGHQGEVGYTQIVKQLMLTPTERLDRHEGWRLFIKETLAHAELKKQEPHLPRYEPPASA